MPIECGNGVYPSVASLHHSQLFLNGILRNAKSLPLIRRDFESFCVLVNCRKFTGN